MAPISLVYCNSPPKHVFVMSVIIFLVLNVFENLMHYNIGKINNNSKEKTQYFQLPGVYDALRMVTVMAVFALLQGILTWYLVT